MEVLIELQKLRDAKVVLSLNAETLAHQPLWKLRHELERHLANQTLRKRVTLVKAGLKLGVMFIEKVTKSFLRLDGWTAFVSGQLDTGQYDDSLEQIYRLMFSSGQPNPWITIAMLIVGSAVAHHTATAVGGVGAAATNFMNKVSPLMSAFLPKPMTEPTSTATTTTTTAPAPLAPPVPMARIPKPSK